VKNIDSENTLFTIHIDSLMGNSNFIFVQTFKRFSRFVGCWVKPYLLLD